MKKFTIRFILILLPFFMVVSIVRFYIVPNSLGDLGKLGLIPFGKECVYHLESLWPSKYQVNTYVNNDNKTYKIISIGDSFSRLKVEGFQNHLAIQRNDTILNFQIYIGKGMESPEQIAVRLLNNGFFQRSKAKVVLVESIERHFIERLRDVDFTANIITDSIPSKYGYKGNLDDLKKKEDHNIIDNKINYLDKSFSWIRLVCGYKNPVGQAELTKDFFTHDSRANKLYFYSGDFHIFKMTPTDISAAKVNIKKMKALFDKHNIQLIYVVAADKYDVYQDFIVNNPYPKNEVLKEFKEFDTTDYFINTKNFIYPLVKKGVKDVYKVNDSHWSSATCKLVAEEINKKIKNDSIQASINQ